MSTYAIVESGSKQYRVEPKTILEVEKINLDENQKEVILDKVLFLNQDNQIQVGKPHIAGAKVICDFLGSFRGDKVVSLKYRRRKHSRSRQGHRQELTRLLVKDIKA